jgi:hypothetical protein
MSAPRPYPDRRGIDPDVRIPILPGTIVGFSCWVEFTSGPF